MPQTIMKQVSGNNGNDSDFMIVLALDTSVTGCSICIGDGERFWHDHMDTERGQAEFLVPMINTVIRNAGYTYNDFDRIAVTVGPGSFTGVRVGLSTAKALGLSLNKPVLGFDTLQVIAKAQKLEQDTLILIDTKRGDFYGQVFTTGGTAKDQAQIWTTEMIENSGIPFIRDAVPDIETMTKMALEAETADEQYLPENAPTPLYLRGAEISQSKRITPQIVKKKA